MKSDLETKRAAVECVDYSPLPESVRCQHYFANGSCKLDTYMMCVEWLKRNPKYQMTEPESEDESPDAPVVELADRRAKHLRVVDDSAERSTQGSADEQARAKKSKRPTSQKQKTAARDVPYDLPAIDDSAAPVPPLLERPELLTEEQMDALAKLGLEVELSVATQTVVLVPKYTTGGGGDRIELSFRDCRTLVTCLQVFPGAKLQAITKRETK